MANSTETDVLRWGQDNGQAHDAYDRTGGTATGDNAVENGAGWDWFEGTSFFDTRNAGDKGETGTGAEMGDGMRASAMSPERQARDRARQDLVWQRVLGAAGGADGAEICAQLRAMTLERTLGPNAGMAAIWMLEGQRALVLQMLRRAGVGVQGR